MFWLTNGPIGDAGIASPAGLAALASAAAGAPAVTAGSVMRYGYAGGGSGARVAVGFPIATADRYVFASTDLGANFTGAAAGAVDTAATLEAAELSASTVCVSRTNTGLNA